MRYALLLVLLMAACERKVPAPVKPVVVAPVPEPAKPETSAPIPSGCPLAAADLAALGFPKDVVAVDFGSNERQKKYQVRSETHNVILFFELNSIEEDQGAGQYAARRSPHEAQGGLVDESKYGSKNFFFPGPPAEVVFLKGKTLGIIQAGPWQERAASPAELEKVVRGAAERLSK
jgi:hypothetical protein